MTYWDDRGVPGAESICRYCGQPVHFSWQWRHSPDMGFGSRGCNAWYHGRTDRWDKPYDRKAVATPARGWRP